MSLKDRIIRTLMPPPVQALRAEYSMIFASLDDLSQPSSYLIDLAIEAVKRAARTDLTDISSRMKKPPFYPDLWPGEHYKLLAGLIQVIQPQCVIEIGTHIGLSALTMRKYLPPSAQLVTFDVIPWHKFSATCLKKEDLKDRKITQKIADLSNPVVFSQYSDLLKGAGIVFIDAEKDGIMEQAFLDNFNTLAFNTRPLFIFDDIRLWNMLKIWRQINRPKLDLTSFGHWSGTGLIEWIPQTPQF